VLPCGREEVAETINRCLRRNRFLQAALSQLKIQDTL
jgi:hypothetical protein